MLLFKGKGGGKLFYFYFCFLLCLGRVQLNFMWWKTFVLVLQV